MKLCNICGDIATLYVATRDDCKHPIKFYIPFGIDDEIVDIKVNMIGGDEDSIFLCDDCFDEIFKIASEFDYLESIGK